jgi:peptidoglycan/LPS O-acetylase OafA/YrhL
MKTESYRPDVDGLRALAILPVVFFHAGLGCPGGFVGVDVFFVISGYLITSLIANDIEAGTFSLLHFWERRIRRILPALLAMILACLVVGWFIFLPSDFAMLGQSAIAQAFLASNVFFWSQSGYFDAASETKPLLHTWSLAVEEQFYLFFPLLLAFLTRRGRFPPIRTFVLLAIISFAASVYGTSHFTSFNFFWLPTRAWELTIGALVALTCGRLSIGPKIAEALGWLGLFLIGLAVFTYDDNTKFPGLAAVAPCFGAAMIILSSESKLTLVGRMLSFKPVVFIGLISYSLYLWHWPMLAYCKYWSLDNPSAGLRATLLVASAVLAVTSWICIEKPFRKRLIFKSRRQVFCFAGSGLLLLLASGFYIFQAHGFPARTSRSNVHIPDPKDYAVFQASITVDEAKAGKFVEFGCTQGVTNRSANILVWGDSHAMALIPVISDLCHRHAWRGVQATHFATAPVLDYCSIGKISLHEKSPQFNDAVLGYITHNSISNVLIVGFWDIYLRIDPSHAEFFKAQLLKTVRAVMDTGAKVYVVKDAPELSFDASKYVQLAEARGRSLDSLGVTVKEYQMANRDLDKTFDQISQMGATVLEPANYFLIRKGFYGAVKNGTVLYRDDHHLSIEGAEMLAPLFEPIFTKN